MMINLACIQIVTYCEKLKNFNSPQIYSPPKIFYRFLNLKNKWIFLFCNTTPVTSLKTSHTRIIFSIHRQREKHADMMKNNINTTILSMISIIFYIEAQSQESS